MKPCLHSAPNSHTELHAEPGKSPTDPRPRNGSDANTKRSLRTAWLTSTPALRDCRALERTLVKSTLSERIV